MIRPGAGDLHLGDQTPNVPLRAGSLRFAGTVANSVGIMAPAAGVSFIPALMAGIVGGAGPLSMILALGAMLLVAYAFVTFTRVFNSAGSVYTFNGRALGVTYGFISAWLLLGVYTAYAASTYVSNANALRVLLAEPGPHAAGGVLVWVAQHWIVLAVALWALTVWFTHRSIRLSSLVIFACEGVALTLVAIVGVTVVAHGGFGGHSLSLAPFTARGLPVATIGLGVVFAFTGFSGFEVAATLGEEAKLPARVVPISMVAALVLAGVVYTLMAWVETIAFRSPGALAASAANSVPLADVATAYLSPVMGTLVVCASLISGVGAQLACVNGATRVLFALGRDGFGPAWVARVHPRHRSPSGALLVIAVLSLIAFLPLIGGNPLTAFFYLATYGADLIIVAYLMTVVAALVWSWQHGRRHPLHLAILLAGIAALAYILRTTVYPVPAFPFNLLIYLTGAMLVLGAGLILLVPGLRCRLSGSPLFAIASATS